jgi:hypothetical protein
MFKIFISIRNRFKFFQINPHFQLLTQIINSFTIGKSCLYQSNL